MAQIIELHRKGQFFTGKCTSSPIIQLMAHPSRFASEGETDRE